MIANGRVLDVREQTTKRGARVVEFSIKDETAGVLQFSFFPQDRSYIPHEWEDVRVVIGGTRQAEFNRFRNAVVYPVMEIQPVDVATGELRPLRAAVG